MTLGSERAAGPACATLPTPSLAPLCCPLGHTQTGVTLMLLPMMVGFFTYKLAVIARESKEFLFEMSPPTKK